MPAGDAHLWVGHDFWDADDIALEMVDRPNIWADGSRERCPVGGFEIAGSNVYFITSEASLLGSVWVFPRSMVMVGWIGVVLLCLSLALCSLFSALSSGALFWLFKLTILVTWVLITLMFLVLLVGCLIMGPFPSLYNWSRMVIFCLLSAHARCQET